MAQAGSIGSLEQDRLGHHPTRVHFDNIRVNNAFQLAHYGKANSDVTAAIAVSEVTLARQLIPIIDGRSGNVGIRKKMLFEGDLYEVGMELSFGNTGPIGYVSVWWDVSDK